jgi:hypothetical protein
MLLTFTQTGTQQPVVINPVGIDTLTPDAYSPELYTYVTMRSGKMYNVRGRLASVTTKVNKALKVRANAAAS